MLKNDNLIRALLRQPVDRTPVWMMRQAGRYLPEYRKLRQNEPNFIRFCQTPSLCCQATMQPLSRFDLDAAIIFSDILTVPHAMGLDLEFVPGTGPVFSDPVQSSQQIKSLAPVGAESLQYVMRAIEATKKELKQEVPLFGFAGSPWTVACYMVEGKGSKAWVAIKAMMYREPLLLHALLKAVTQTTISYLNGQIEAGADAVMLFDSWGGVLPYHAYPEFSLQYMQYIAESIHRTYQGRRIPLVFFTKNAAPWLDQIALSGCDAISLDSSVDLSMAKSLLNEKVALQGNLDPQALYADEGTIRAEVQRIMSIMDNSAGYVFNLGHGIDKDTPIEGVHSMLRTIRECDLKRGQ